ncbi:uncharacterized protein LOC115629880 [Scaptodrosophila lebanonensis]|uniref:Uncharacterized protein LOC115629880 n=1 Tax=Drosophila lebanonensis TaxID=7225 RepID=A0A6J2U0Y3_DROLE|nr:uncharacterized protein LOC115629880 [Scaptodrosophila lebanonensis]
MSKFLSYYNLFPIPDPKEFLGLDADREEGNVITTLARNVVVILNISTQKQLCSWSMPEKLSAKVIYDPKSQKYVGVFGNHALRLWDVDTPDVGKCKKLKFQKSIAQLVATDAEALVLYSDDTFEFLSDALNSRKDQQEDTSEQLQIAASKTISKALVHTFDDGTQMLTYFEEKHANSELRLIARYLTTESRKKNIRIKREMVRVTGYAVIDGEGQPQLLTIWSDKRIFLLNLGNRNYDPPGQFVSMLAELNVESKLSVQGISRNFVAIYGANYGKEGASLLVYNTQFKVVNAKQYFKVYLDFSRLWARGEHILLAMGNNIAAVRYRMNQDMLVDMLGSQFSDTHISPIELDHINEEEALEAGIKFLGNYQPADIVEQTNTDNETLAFFPPADGKQIAYESPEIFNKELSELLKQHVYGEVANIENGYEDVNVTLMSNFFDLGPQNTAVQAIVRQLERSGAGEQEISEKLLTLFIKTQNTDHVLMCLRRYSNISERMLAWALRYALDNNSADIEATNGDPEAIYTDPALKSNKELLNAVLACSFESSAIEEHLRQRLELSHVLRILKHLHVLMTSPDFRLEERPGYDSSLKHTELQTLKWLGALMTSHFTLLSISKDVEILTVLKSWSVLLEGYVRSLDDLQAVLPLLMNIVEGRMPKPKYDNRWYSIEKVVLY